MNTTFVLVILFGTWNAMGGKEIQLVTGFTTLAACEAAVAKLNEPQTKSYCIEVK